jgi:hypothetical protein
MPNVYNRCKLKTLNGTLDLDSASNIVACLLLKSTAPAFDPTHNFVADVVAASAEISVAGYARKDLSTITLVEDDSGHRGDAKNNELTFASLTAGQTIGAAVVYRRAAGGVENDATSELIGYYDLPDTPTNGGDVKLQFSGLVTAGIFLAAIN